eukprot:m.360111 g.360111  ORF g.360111 m.360111 type:complete len:66 (+) comp16635_c0_seq4:744-941(+)
MTTSPKDGHQAEHADVGTSNVVSVIPFQIRSLLALLNRVDCWLTFCHKSYLSTCFIMHVNLHHSS